jgi:hypothetical protein
MQPHRIGARPGASGVGYFCRNKSNPLKAEDFNDIAATGHFGMASQDQPQVL